MRRGERVETGGRERERDGERRREKRVGIERKRDKREFDLSFA